MATLEQKFGGIGIVLSKDPETDELTVTTPLADSPAYAQGIRAGDIICSIDGESTKGLSSERPPSNSRGGAAPSSSACFTRERRSRWTLRSGEQ